MNSGRFGFVGRRLVGLIPLMLGILLVVMLLLELTPGDPARSVVGTRAPQEEVDRVRQQMGLDLPLWQRYANYVIGAVQGNLGTSFKTGQDVVAQVVSQLPVTVAVALAGVLLALVVSIPLSVLAARKRDRAADHLVRSATVLGLGLPSFWVAVMLITFVALPTGWFPVAGFGNGFLEHARSLVLPAIVVAISIAPPMIRSLRSTVLELESAEQVLAGRTLGFENISLLRRFVLRNAVSPLITVTANQASYALFGAVIVEVAFGLPGMGRGLVTAAATRDFPLVQGYTITFAVLVVLVYLISDLVTAIIDPRVRISG